MVRTSDRKNAGCRMITLSSALRGKRASRQGLCAITVAARWRPVSNATSPTALPALSR